MANSFDLSVYSVLEVLVSGMHTLARAEDKDLREELMGLDANGKLVGAKIALTRDDSIERLQALTKLVLALTEYILQTSLASDDERGGEPRSLLAIVERVREHARRRRGVTQAVLHPSGECTCGGEGDCEWCRTHCLQCGMGLPDGSNSCMNSKCAPLGVGAALGNLGLDPELWEVITTKAGVPVAALRFNGVSYPLPQTKMEALKRAILVLIET